MQFMLTTPTHNYKFIQGVPPISVVYKFELSMKLTKLKEATKFILILRCLGAIVAPEREKISMPKSRENFDAQISQLIQ